MAEENKSEDRKYTMVQMWVGALAIAVFFCTLFSAVISVVLGNVSNNLKAINDRLAVIEERATLLANMPATAPVAPVPAVAEPAPLGPFPTVIPPSLDAPAATPEEKPASEAAPAAVVPVAPASAEVPLPTPAQVESVKEKAQEIVKPSEPGAPTPLTVGE